MFIFSTQTSSLQKHTHQSIHQHQLSTMTFQLFSFFLAKQCRTQERATEKQSGGTFGKAWSTLNLYYGLLYAIQRCSVQSHGQCREVGAQGHQHSTHTSGFNGEPGGNGTGNILHSFGLILSHLI